MPPQTIPPTIGALPSPHDDLTPELLKPLLVEYRKVADRRTAASRVARNQDALHLARKADQQASEDAIAAGKPSAAGTQEAEALAAMRQARTEVKACDQTLWRMHADIIDLVADHPEWRAEAKNLRDEVHEQLLRTLGDAVGLLDRLLEIDATAGWLDNPERRRNSHSGQITVRAVARGTRRFGGSDVPEQPARDVIEALTAQLASK